MDTIQGLSGLWPLHYNLDLLMSRLADLTTVKENVGRASVAQMLPDSSNSHHYCTPSTPLKHPDATGTKCFSFVLCLTAGAPEEGVRP